MMLLFQEKSYLEGKKRTREPGLQNGVTTPDIIELGGGGGGVTLQTMRAKLQSRCSISGVKKFGHKHKKQSLGKRKSYQQHENLKENAESCLDLSESLAPCFDVRQKDAQPKRKKKKKTPIIVALNRYPWNTVKKKKERGRLIKMIPGEKLVPTRGVKKGDERDFVTA